jgi:hypothetical protein
MGNIKMFEEFKKLSNEFDQLKENLNEEWEGIDAFKYDDSKRFSNYNKDLYERIKKLLYNIPKHDRAHGGFWAGTEGKDWDPYIATIPFDYIEANGITIDELVEDENEEDDAKQLPNIYIDVDMGNREVEFELTENFG